MSSLLGLNCLYILLHRVLLAQACAKAQNVGTSTTITGEVLGGNESARILDENIILTITCWVRFRFE
jgi:hypothetical protein